MRAGVRWLEGEVTFTRRSPDAQLPSRVQLPFIPHSVPSGLRGHQDSSAYDRCAFQLYGIRTGFLYFGRQVQDG